MIDDAGNWVEPYLKEAYSGITGKIYFEPDSDFNALVMSVAAGLAKSMPTAQKELFSNWAGLPKDDWNEFHYEEFGLAFLHYLQSLNQRDKVSQSTLEEAARVFTNAALPPLKHPLTEEIIHMLDNLFDK
jgi:hypothetical protein